LSAAAAALAFVCFADSSLLAADAKTKEKAVLGKIVRLDPRLDKIVPKDAVVEKLAEGLDWSEGPLWVKGGGYLLFSDIPRNQIVKWKEGAGTSIFMQHSGYTGRKKFTGPEPGTNGLTLDSKGRLVMCCHGDRVIRRLEDLANPGGKKTVLVSHYGKKRLNSPNDLIYKSGGDLYFTDPPYGLPKRYDDPARELDFCGVYRLATDGKLTLLTKEMTRPNGLAFSPDEKTLYVAQSDPAAALWKAFPVKSDGTLGRGKLFYDATEHVGRWPGLPDGMKVDARGNLFATGPGGVWIFDPDGTPLGRLDTGEKTANCNWGDSEPGRVPGQATSNNGNTLYITADMYLGRIKLTTQGAGF
jgi:gluconolactonase